jgi:hypothetical protein
MTSHRTSLTLLALALTFGIASPAGALPVDGVLMDTDCESSDYGEECQFICVTGSYVEVTVVESRNSTEIHVEAMCGDEVAESCHGAACSERSLYLGPTQIGRCVPGSNTKASCGSDVLGVVAEISKETASS